MLPSGLIEADTPMFVPQLRLWTPAVLLTAVTLASGCSFFRTADDDSDLRTLWADLRRSESDEALAARTIRSATLEANIVRRPRSDSRIRQLVWEELDESGVMTPEERQKLNQSGIRAAIAGSSVPWVLQNLVNESTRVAVAHDDTAPSPTMATPFQKPVGPTFAVFEKGVSQLEIQSRIDLSQIPVEKVKELSHLSEFSDLRCVIEITAEEVKDGWVLLNVLPQLHVGAMIQRLSVSGNHDRLPVRQKIHPLYEQQFRIKLHRGETVVIGGLNNDQWNIGRLFFQSETGTSSETSMLMIRLISSQEIQGQSERLAGRL